MRIAVNTRLLLKDRLEGIGWFTYQSLKRITREHPEHQFFFIFDRPYDEEFIFAPNVTPVVAFPQARHPFLWYLFFEWSIPFILKKYKIDLFISTDSWISLSTRTRTFNVFHDLNYEHNPHYIKPFLQRKYYLHYSRKFAHRSNRIATVSECTKQDLVSLYGISPSLIDVVYNGCNEQFVSFNEHQKQATRDTYSGGAQYFLYVGAIHERKNIENMLLAFDRYKSTTTNDSKLLIVGKKMWHDNKYEKIYNNLVHKDSVIFTGRLDNESLAAVFSASIALLYVSLFEGFGIPILEAFGAQTAVITSNISSMPEVAGQGALLVNPLSIQDISQAMIQVSSNEAFRASLIEKGTQQLAKFSWDLTAQKLWQSIETCIQAK
jgi:glycosyltransferase involved in cell wall biosynthesis